MTPATPDKLHYVRIPQGRGARAEMVRLVYVLAGRPYVDVLAPFAEVATMVAGKNPFKQLPFVVTSSGRVIYQALAIMHHAAHGTPVWPDDSDRLTDALAVAMGGYDLYQAFAGFTADDVVAKKKFEEKRMPQYFDGLDEIYRARAFAAGEVASFADCVAYEAVAWCVRRNDVARARLQASPGLLAFNQRFEAIPAVREFMARQAAAREKDESL